MAAQPSRSVSFKQAAASMPGEQIAVRRERKKQYATYRRDLAGTQFAEVEVDIETGDVRVLKVVGRARLRPPDQPAHDREPDHRRA